MYRKGTVTLKPFTARNFHMINTISWCERRTNMSSWGRSHSDCACEAPLKVLKFALKILSLFWRDDIDDISVTGDAPPWYSISKFKILKNPVHNFLSALIRRTSCSQGRKLNETAKCSCHCRGESLLIRTRGPLCCSDPNCANGSLTSNFVRAEFCSIKKSVWICKDRVIQNGTGIFRRRQYGKRKEREATISQRRWMVGVDEQEATIIQMETHNEL